MLSAFRSYRFKRFHGKVWIRKLPPIRGVRDSAINFGILVDGLRNYENGELSSGVYADCARNPYTSVF